MSVIVHQPLIQVFSELLDGFIERCSGALVEALVQHGSPEPFGKEIGLWSTDFGTTVLDLVQFELE